MHMSPEDGASQVGCRISIFSYILANNVAKFYISSSLGDLWGVRILFIESSIFSNNLIRRKSKKALKMSDVEHHRVY